MLQIDRLEVAYGALTVLRDISLTVNNGEIVTVIGANGAGKSTLLKSISGLLPPSGGTIQFDGKEIARTPPHQIVKLGVSQVPEGRQLFAELSVLDNLELGAFSRGGNAAENAKELAHVYDLFPILRERSVQMAGTLSGGEQQMLAIGRALMARPKLLLLDEPSLGLAPMVVRSIFEIIMQLKASDLAILLVEQNARAALSMADRAYVLETGRVVSQGLGKDLLADPQVQRSYLGESIAH
ncbi:MAG: ABC transporter ATP-binding protein [Dehalococcoidia bacterium]|nr:ABC transporter ATP-binding protein [Dehalococcoidia bacterium]